MFRIDHPSAAAALPAPVAAGTPGYFTGGDPVHGVAPTVVTEDWANMVQEEIMSVVLAAGLTPDKTNHAQLLAAIAAVGSQFQYADHTAAGTFSVTAPAWANHAEIAVIGGGGGGGSSATGYSGGGGGAGGYVTGIIAVTPGTNYSVTVGAGGAGATSGAGGNGGASSFDSLASANGGVGGNASAPTSAGGAGGTAAGTGLRAFSGGYGGDGCTSSATVQGGHGANGPFGGAGRTGAAGGYAGVAPGAGGGGSWNSSGSGGAGAPGAVLVKWLP